MNKLIKLLTLFFIVQLHAQISFTKIGIKNIPSEINFNGNFVNGFKWKDKLGENLVVLSETGETEDIDDSRKAELFAYHFVQKNNSFIPDWKIYDFEKECQVDLTVTFLKNAFSISDLDKNGVAEIWILYKTSCKGDISPDIMKIIMYENGVKYAMRGENKIQVSEENYYGGSYKFDEAFLKSPKSFQEFAKKLWKNNAIQKLY